MEVGCLRCELHSLSSRQHCAEALRCSHSLYVLKAVNIYIKKSNIQCYLNVLGIRFMGMETGIVVVETSPTLIGSVALDTLELWRLASTANKVVSHSSNTTTLEATALYHVCAELGVKVEGEGDKRKRGSKMKFDKKRGRGGGLTS